MTDVRCPRCRLFSPPGTQRCQCGWSFDGSTATAGDALAAHRIGSEIVIGAGGTLPPRCIKCNAPAEGAPIRHTFVDSDVGGAPGGLLSAARHFGSRRTGWVYISLCRIHRRRRRRVRQVSAALLLAALAIGIYAGVASRQPPRLLVETAVTVGLAAPVVFVVFQPYDLKARVGPTIRITGAGTAFLDSLPAGPGVVDAR
jgi:hypothetical protein